MQAMHGKPVAWLSVRRVGPYVDEDAVVVTTTVGDLAGSHGAAYDALKRAGIKPARTAPGAIHVTFDPLEVTEDQARAVVASALRSGGVRIYE